MRHQDERLREIEWIADWLDTRFKGPGGFRFGLDGLLGLIPGFGDVVTNIASGYIILRAAQWNYPGSVIAHMILNFLIDNLLDSIPFLGFIFDFFFKSNQRNLKIMRAYTLEPERTRKSSAVSVVVTLLVLIAIALALGAASVFLLVLAIQWLAAAFSG
jgi:hypothetical protein